MRPSVLSASLVALGLAGLGAGSLSATATRNELPGVAAACRILPLMQAMLTAEELAAYQKLASGSEDARRFLIARGFLRYAKLVKAGELDPLRLPELPSPEDWDRKFFSTDEAATVDVALGRFMVASMKLQMEKGILVYDSNGDSTRNCS